ncbi:hypothetical protein E2562_020638 [Oryza meyeriana var. granulata]|uniref:Large ribosomal subunit protein bL12 C-terminal domain-containing protein n=1 Tax=Oryza meyeriana var. granulata TaxID=110450 RepID=A0A6G1EBA9_9ORYZ|nr:hypothetical protein E2562_020638 [Oryza meyeriana var. granulata]
MEEISQFRSCKTKIIKQSRTFTFLELKEVKELVEKARVILEQSFTEEKDEAIIEKIKEISSV